METLDLGIDGLDDVEQIGRGGSSRVYRAKQVELDRLVALKVLKAGDDPNVVRRFDRERKAMGRLSLNEGIVPVYSSGLTDSGEPYLIMPYYEKGSLQDRLNRGPVPWEEAVHYITAAARTMAAAHEAGVVHLDLKPANILLSSENAPRIADFGIAKLVNDPSSSSTTGAAFTPSFSSPEILLGSSATPASDVYGLAATLWSLIAGRPPFRAENGDDNTLMAVVGRVVHQPIEDLRHLAPGELCSVIETAMAKDPSDRYPTAGALAQALAAVTENLTTGHGPRLWNFDETTALQEPPVGGGLQFEEAVPPGFVPASPIGLAGGLSPPRLTAIGAGVLAAVVVIISLVALASIFGSDDSSTTTPDATTSVPIDNTAGEGTVITASSSSGAGPTITATSSGSGTDVTEPSGPVTSDSAPSTTRPPITTAATTGSTSPSTTTTTTEPSTTTSTSTTTTEPTTTTTTEPTTTSDPTTTTEPTTTTTEPTTTAPPTT